MNERETTPMNEPVSQNLPALDTLFGEQHQRLQGIANWEQIASLGAANIQRLIQLAQETVQKLMAANTNYTDLRELARGIDQLSVYLSSASQKPVLPRLRVETFHKDDLVAVYIGDSLGHFGTTKWVQASITEVRKAYKREWADGSPNGGYFWRCEATSNVPFFPDQCSVAFSTSEPRVLKIDELNYLKHAEQSDPLFLQIFVSNAHRTWTPLWCIERNGCATGKVDMQKWLLSSGDHNFLLTDRG